MTLTQDQASQIEVWFGDDGYLKPDALKGHRYSIRLLKVKSGRDLPPEYTRMLPTFAAITDPNVDPITGAVKYGPEQWIYWESQGLGYWWMTSSDNGYSVLVLVAPWN